MIVTLEEILNASEGLKKILSADLPIKLAYRLGKYVKILNKELTNYEERRMDLIKKYGEPNDNGSEYKIKPENADKVMKDMMELHSIEVDLDVIPIKLSEIENVKLSPIDISNLDKFIKKA